MIPSQFNLTPKCLPICSSFQSALPILNRHVSLPVTADMNNEIKYYLMRLADEWKKYCASDIYHRDIRRLEQKYQKTFQRYMFHCSKLDELETNFARDLIDKRPVLLSQPQGSVQFQTRYSLRIAELKRLKNICAKDLIHIRIEMIAILGFPLLECMFHLFRIFPEHVFAQIRDGEYTHVLHHALSWIHIKCQPDVPLNKGTVDTIINTLESYIDYRMDRDAERFIVRGVDFFQNQSCQNFLEAIYIAKRKKEAFYLLLIAQRYQKLQEKRTTIGNNKLSAEVRYFLAHDVVLHTISFLVDMEKCMQPEYFLWM